jgi:transcriptional regulator of arginine metabolism
LTEKIPQCAEFCIDIHFWCIFIQARPQHCEPRFRFVRASRTANERTALKFQRHNAIRDLLASSLVTNQDELRRKLRRRGFAVTQATLSRDIHELRLSKGPSGYSLPNGNGSHGTSSLIEEAGPPTIAEMIESLGLRVRQAMNQVVVGTVMGGAQPVAAALDREGWPEVVGTIAGDDTVLVICPDVRRAGEVEARLRTILES